MCQALVYLMGVYDCSKETKTPTLEELMFNKKENINNTYFIINHGKIFFDPPPRVKEIKPKINKGDPIKLNSICIAKETQNKIK